MHKPDDTAGALLLAPVYQSNFSHDTVQARQRNVRGFVVLALRYAKLFGAIENAKPTGSEGDQPYDLTVYDVTTEGEPVELFAQHAHDGDDDEWIGQAELPAYEERIDVGGRSWRVVLRSTGGEYLSITAHSWNAAAVSLFLT